MCLDSHRKTYINKNKHAEGIVLIFIQKGFDGSNCIYMNHFDIAIHTVHSYRPIYIL